MNTLRSTERHLVLLKVPFGLKAPKKNGFHSKRFGTKLYKSNENKLAENVFGKRFGAISQRPIRILQLEKIRPLATLSTQAPVIRTSILNPEKPAPDDLKDVTLEPITPAYQPRFPKDSQVLPSVTKILSATMPASSQFLLDRWKESMIKKLGIAGFNKYQQDTFERGRVLHALLASYLMGRGEPENLSKEVVINLWKSIENVVKENITNVRLVEHVVTHSEMRYRGIVDCVAFYKNELVVIDFKTAEKPKKTIESLYDNPLQITAYCGALNNDQTIPRTVIDRNICAGLVIVAYIDGSPASVYHIGREKLVDEYWSKWTSRLEQYTQMEAMKADQSVRENST